MNLLLELIKRSGLVSKGDLMKWVYQENYNKVDSAYPTGYGNILRENGMTRISRSGNYCYDYNEKSWGELVNVNDEFLSKLVDQMRNDDDYSMLKEVYEYLKQFEDYFNK